MVKLHIPKKVPFDESEPDGEHVLTMEDWCSLKRILQSFDSIQHLEVYVKRGNIEQRHKLRNIDLLEWLDENRWPNGCKQRDVFVAVLNVFAYEYEKKGVLPTGLPFDHVLAKAADDLGVTERTFKSQLNSLIKGKYIDLSYGNVLFPAVRKDANPEA